MFFIILDDCGILDIDNAFAGAMSFQPAVPSKDMKMLVRFIVIIVNHEVQESRVRTMVPLISMCSRCGNPFVDDCVSF